MLSAADLDRICPLPPDRDVLPRVLTRAMAEDLGVGRRGLEHRLVRRRWRRVHPRVYATVDSLTERDRMDAALLFAGDGAALSGAAALRASEIPGVAMPATVLVLVPPANRTRSTRGVQVRRTLRPIVPEQWTGPRRVEVSRAAADESLRLRRIDDVRALVARVVQGGHCTVDELAAELVAGPRQGSAHLRRALEEVGWGVESAPEAKAARILRRAGVTGWKPNVVLRLPDGTRRRVDFYWAALRAALEIDSREWHVEPEDWSGTWDRHLDLAKAGIAAIHRPPSALIDEAGFVRDVRAWLAARESELRVGLARA